MFTTNAGVEAINNAAMELRVVQVRHYVQEVIICLIPQLRSAAVVEIASASTPSTCSQAVILSLWRM
jgi:hypothetical protein